jgi:hypothetical protein
LLVGSGRARCYILYTHVVRYRVRYCHIHYIGDTDVFAQHEEAIRTAIMRRHAVRFVVVDSRLVQELKLKRSFDFWSPAHAVYRPVGDISPSQVDNLYSDVVMLRLAIMPHLRHEIEKVVRRLIPGVAEAQP